MDRRDFIKKSAWGTLAGVFGLTTLKEAFGNPVEYKVKNKIATELPKNINKFKHDIFIGKPFMITGMCGSGECIPTFNASIFPCSGKFVYYKE